MRENYLSGYREEKIAALPGLMLLWKGMPESSRQQKISLDHSQNVDVPAHPSTEERTVLWENTFYSCVLEQHHQS